MRYATAFLDHGLLALLALPCPAAGRGASGGQLPISFGVLLCSGRTQWKSPWATWGLSFVPFSHTLALWLLSRLRQWWGGNDGGRVGHEWDSSCTTSAGSSSCESSDSDVRIIEPPVRRGAPTDPAFKTGPRSDRQAEPQGGGGACAASASDGHPHPHPATGQTGAGFGLRASPVVLKGGGGRLARRWECKLSPLESPPHPSAVFLGPAPRKLRLGRDHRLKELPLAMRGRAMVRSVGNKPFSRIPRTP